jgi:hypothetical protein
LNKTAVINKSGLLAGALNWPERMDGILMLYHSVSKPFHALD